MLTWPASDETLITIVEAGLVSANERSWFALSSGTYDLVNMWIHSTLCKLIAFIFEFLERSIFRCELQRDRGSGLLLFRQKVKQNNSM